MTTKTYTIPFTSKSSRILVCPICPDLLDYEALGEEDNFRGRVVRGFFWLIRWWK